MKIRVLYFAGLQDLAGEREKVYRVEENSTLADLCVRIFEDIPNGDTLRNRVRIAVNEEYADPGYRLSEGDTVALIPPVSGG